MDPAARYKLQRNTASTEQFHVFYIQASVHSSASSVPAPSLILPVWANTNCGIPVWNGTNVQFVQDFSQLVQMLMSICEHTLGSALSNALNASAILRLSATSRGIWKSTTVSCLVRVNIAAEPSTTPETTKHICELIRKTCMLKLYVTMTSRTIQPRMFLFYQSRTTNIAR